MKSKLICLVRDSTIYRYRTELESKVLAPVEWSYCHEMSEMELAKLMEDADIYVGAFLPASVARRAKRLRLVQSTGIGIDRIALDSLDPDVPVATVGSHGRSVAEHVLMVMLSLSRRLLVLDRGLRRGEWLSGAFDQTQRLSDTLRGKTCGLVGYGTIGKEVGRLVQSLDMRVAAVRRDPSRYTEADRYLEWSDGPDGLPRLMNWADFVVVSIPMIEQTRGLIDRTAIGWMRPSSSLINVSRGPVVDELALYEALRTRAIRGAALDVWYRYPAGSELTYPANCPFWELDNVILTPHDSSATSETYGGRVQQIAQNIQALWENRELVGVISRALGSRSAGE